MGKTKIEWADFTMNPWVGCQKVSAGCDNCYAEGWAKRSGLVKWGPHADRRRTSEAYWRQPIKWNKQAAAEGVRYRVFCASLADVFDNQVPPEWRADLFKLIEATPSLDWLLLTKRPENIAKLLPPPPVEGWPWPNVWFGTTAEDQEHFDHRWPILKEIPAWVRFISYEPAIGPLRLWKGFDAATADSIKGLDWLICGGESGPRHRPMDRGWAEDVRRDCARAGVAFFFKQMAGKAPIPPELLVREFPK
jgi:protein gp37